MPDLLSTITFSVFGLGNSCYEHYNAAAKLVDKSLHALGADRLICSTSETTTIPWKMIFILGERPYGAH